MPPLQISPGFPRIVGSLGSADALDHTTLEEARTACDLIEIRLDLLDAETIGRKPWRKFQGIPLLFTSRCESEGGARGLDPDVRRTQLLGSLDDASLIDIELASAAVMRPLLSELAERGIPWIASYHDFRGVPTIGELSSRCMAARQAGAVAFKAAFELGWQMDQLGPLSVFLTCSRDYPISLMGMGPLGPVSRVLFAQLGSVLNYGYLGDAPTAPGQWSARQLHEAMHSVARQTEATPPA